MSVSGTVVHADDILIYAPMESLQEIHRTFNSFYSKIKFTIEMPLNICINFLNTTVTIRNSKFMNNWYQKQTW